MNRNVRTFIVTAIWLGFLLSCAGIMQVLEDDEDRKLRRSFTHVFNDFLEGVNVASNASPTRDCLTEEQLKNFIKVIELPLQRGFLTSTRLGMSNGSSLIEEITWNYESSIFFIICLVTTVGYGNIVPLSASGKLFSAFVVLVGVPLTVLYYGVWIERLLRFSNVFNRKLYDFARSRGAPRLTAKILVMSCVLSSAAIVTIFLPATFFHACEENWTFTTAVYYCVLTLATSGLGDIVPSTDSRCGHAITMITAIYIVNAVFLTMFMLSNLFEIYEMDKETEEERKPLKLNGEEEESETNERSIDAKKETTTPPAVLHDMYLTVLGK